MKHRILVTGANGRIGRLLCKKLEKMPIELYQLIRKKKPDESEFEDSKIYKIDLYDPGTELADCLVKIRPHLILHCAALVPKSDQILSFEANARMTQNLVNSIAGLNLILLNLSSASELGSIPAHSLPVREDFPCAPVSNYGKSKLNQTEIVLDGARRFGYQGICARIFNILDLPQSLELPVVSWVHQIQEMALGQRPPLLQVGDLSISRDFLSSEETCEVILELGFSALSNPNIQGNFNIGSGIPTRLHHIVDELYALAPVKFSIQSSPSQFANSNIREIVADVTQIQEVLRRPIRFHLTDSLRKMLI